MHKRPQGFRIACLGVVMTGIGALLLPAHSDAFGDNVESRVKAAYLLHFAQYVYWPRPSADASTPLTLGVLGSDPMAAILEKTVAGKTVNNRAISVRQFSSGDQIDRCDILFIPRSASKSAAPALAALAGKPTMTVSDKEGFSRAGGMIEFVFVDDSIRFSINNDAVERSGLKLNSELLRVAYAINGRRR